MSYPVSWSLFSILIEAHLAFHTKQAQQVCLLRISLLLFFLSPRKQKQQPVELNIVGRLSQWRVLKLIKLGVPQFFWNAYLQITPSAMNAWKSSWTAVLLPWRTVRQNWTGICISYMWAAGLWAYVAWVGAQLRWRPGTHKLRPCSVRQDLFLPRLICRADLLWEKNTVVIPEK